ncbi:MULTISPECIES: cell division protein ZapE [Auritidibacter]|uniref:Cell division protein ZapE n=1 Tax=Auritidibacter ignavus TaxID=678932 RepID=A0AAJ6DDA4_9MICC|nr:MULTISPECIES: cell division protein ZapE [Auritidibacter]AXR73450.1 cell division protein ZapE [Auritidibacter sp. NML130574]NIH70745.1 cell division protein ZapE [Auritidibacter ignavus]RMX23050.1 cell division protein ZapE [Auritidibacter ignavus]WGH84290.1 cell division protein ZapE [Auritidibacter ignavus]WGH93612.1 cell division protein ZapE [Auritidibacter ignavus]
MTEIVRLAERQPQVSAEQLLAGFHPSYRFGEVSFETYIPDDRYPSQAEAVSRLKKFAESISGSGSNTSGGFLGLFGKKKKKDNQPAGLYLDGGFGVGKTHLLASLWHAAGGDHKAFGTFVEYTNLVGALTFSKTVEVLKQYSLVCIDEFELDDPGDTVLMSRLMRELADAGVKLAATSNTLPGALGEGRFAAQDFKREIQVLSSQFEVVRIDGEDYRHRGLEEAPDPVEDDKIEHLAQENFPEAHVVAVDDFAALMKNLSQVHPSRYREMVKDIDVLVLHDVETITEQAMALRFVVLADRLYDKDVPVIASGVPFDQLFTEEMMNGGYLKKYFRTVSRMTALAREGVLGQTEAK